MSNTSTRLNQLQQLFPNVELTVIESVLIASENQLDVTIDHLLKMSIDDKNETFTRASEILLNDDAPPPYPGFTHRPVASALPRCSRSNNDDQIFNAKISSNQKERTEKMFGKDRTADTLSNLNNKTLRKTRICSPMLHDFIRRIEKGETFSNSLMMIAEEPMTNRTDYSYGRDPLNYFDHRHFC